MDKELIKTAQKQSLKSLTKLDSNKASILFAAGGTAGHVNPALAVARELQQVCPELQIVFCGNGDGMEKNLVELAGFPFYWIESTGLVAKDLKHAWRFYTVNRRGIREVEELMHKLNVVACFGAGGYTSFPPIWVAKKANLPVFLHEQNAFSGKSTRFLSKGAEVVFISYENTRRDFSQAKEVVLSGNPVDDAFYTVDKPSAREKLNLAEDLFYILITGGSLGAASLNKIALQLNSRLAERTDLPAYKIHLVTGKSTYDDVRQSPLAQKDNIELSAYELDMPNQMAAADLLITRAGAGTCAEIAVLQKPSILIPYPFATNNHQHVNAKALVDQGRAILIDEHELDFDSLCEIVIDLMQNPWKLSQMQQAETKTKQVKSAKIIATKIIQVLAERYQEVKDGRKK